MNILNSLSSDLTKAAVLVCMVIALTNCNASKPKDPDTQINNLPSGAKDEAMRIAEAWAAKGQYCQNHQDIVKNFQVKSATNSVVTPADSANGIEQRWSVYVIFIYSCDGGNKWGDGARGLTMESRGGSWKGVE